MTTDGYFFARTRGECDFKYFLGGPTPQALLRAKSLFERLAPEHQQESCVAPPRARHSSPSPRHSRTDLTIPVKTEPKGKHPMDNGQLLSHIDTDLVTREAKALIHDVFELPRRCAAPPTKPLPASSTSFSSGQQKENSARGSPPSSGPRPQPTWCGPERAVVRVANRDRPHGLLSIHSGAWARHPHHLCACSAGVPHPRASRPAPTPALLRPPELQPPAAL